MHGPPCLWDRGFPSFLKVKALAGPLSTNGRAYIPPTTSRFVSVNTSTSVLHAHADAAFLIPTGERESGQVHPKKKQEEEEENPVHPLSVTTMISFCPVAKTGVKPFYPSIS